jgi:hypothetical protein
MTGMSNDKPNQPPDNRFSSLHSATDAMDALDEPMVATTQLLFRVGDTLVPAHQRPAAPPLASPAPAPADPVALLQELLARIAAHRRDPPR